MGILKYIKHANFKFFKIKSLLESNIKYIYNFN